MPWSEVLTAIAGSGITAGGALAVAGRFLKRGITDIAEAANQPLIEKVNVVVEDVNKVKLDLATQFGGNGGGMRQAINELRVQVARLEGPTRPSPYPASGKHSLGE